MHSAQLLNHLYFKFKYGGEMQSKITIQTTKIQTIEIKKDTLNIHNFKRLKMASIEGFNFKEGAAIVQSISHYLAHIELFEYSFNQHVSINFTINTPAFFMYADIQSGLSHLCYQPAGKYRRIIPPGNNKIMLLTFRSNWLNRKCQKIKELNSFINHFGNPEGLSMHLPRVGIASNLISSLIKMDTIVDDIHMDDEGYIFINSCINKYYNKLKSRNETVHYYHHKAADLSAFIKANFATEEAENLPKLATRFMVSERSLARLAKIAFGMPLHEKVIQLRIHYALDLLLNTEKLISEIAKLSGYKEPCYFSKAFKKHFGICPKSVKRLPKIPLALNLQV